MPTLAQDRADDTIQLSPDEPVFVDPSGRRRRVVRIVAIVACVALAGYSALLVAALLGASISPNALLPLSGGSAPAVSAPPSTSASSVPAPGQPAGSVNAQPTSPPQRLLGVAPAVTTARIAPTTNPPAASGPAPAPVATAPTTAPPTTAPPTPVRNSHAPTEPPGWTKHGAPTT